MSERPTIHHRDRALNEQQGAYMNQHTPDPRADYVAGLRAVADLIERHPELPLPLGETFSVFCDDKDTAAAWVRALPGAKPKETDSGQRHMIFGRRAGVFGPFGFQVWIERDKVCTRVVTGARKVTKTVPAPGAPMITVTETVEDVEWICEPLLAEVTA